MNLDDQFERLEKNTFISLAPKVCVYRYDQVPLIGYYLLRKEYYPNGNIKRKGWAFKQGVVSL
jgi:hypothetical protein